MNNFLSLFFPPMDQYTCSTVQKFQREKCSDAQGGGRDWIEHWLLGFQDVSHGFLLLLAFSGCSSAAIISSNICSQVLEGKRGSQKPFLTVSLLCMWTEQMCACGSLRDWGTVRMRSNRRQHLFLSVDHLCLVPRIIYIKEVQAALSLTSSRFKMLILFQELLPVLLKFERKTNAAQSPGESFSFLN